jgi:hypothetical protein
LPILRDDEDVFDDEEEEDDGESHDQHTFSIHADLRIAHLWYFQQKIKKFIGTKHPNFKLFSLMRTSFNCYLLLVAILLHFPLCALNSSSTII